MLEALKKILGKSYQPLNQIELSSMFLIHNYNYLSSRNPAVKVAPVLKSNAYGHGITQIGKLADSLGAPFLCVDSLYEGYELLKAGIRTNILIMGYIDPVNLKVKKLPFSYAVYSKEQLDAVVAYQKDAGIHIKIDTGMHRLGLMPDELPEFISTVKQYRHIRVEGLMAHFAESEHPKSDLTRLQISQFKQALTLLREQGIKPRWIHHGNSGAILNQEQLELNTYSNMVRAGIALYGIDPRPEKEDENLKPILRLSTKIVQIKQLGKGDRVGYNGIFTAQKDMTIALLPIGYYDGIDRRLSNKGTMMIGEIQCQVLGRVSMNITAIDISDVQNPQIGQQVLVYSNDQHHPNTIKNTAALCDTIPYDILVHLAASTRRDLV
jgi:alanine racemase